MTDRRQKAVPDQEVEIARAYDLPERRPGEFRALVDRLWPRGVTKGALDYDEWVKDAAPSSDLRRWYGHDPDRFEEFARRYRAELRSAPGVLDDLVRKDRVLLITATRDIEHSGARVLAEVLRTRAKA